MDEMRLKFHTRFMRGIIAKLLVKAIRINLGYKVDIKINEFAVNMVGDEIHVSTNAEAKLTKDEFAKIMNTIGLGD